MAGVKQCECGCGAFTTRVKQREGEYHAGDYRRFVRGHYRRLWPTKGYAEAAKQDGGRRIQVHRLRAERALGRPLPLDAVVHHADGSKRADAPLVICPDEAYHRLLHRRMAILRAGGNPNTDRICGKCRQAKPLSDFNRDRSNRYGVYAVCRLCDAAQRRVRYARHHDSL